MAIKQPISKKRLQEELYKMGASATLVQMPAVIERLHQEYVYLDDEEITIGENGEIITPNGIFRENGKFDAEYESDELKIDIDLFGMEKNAEVKSTKSRTYRKDNKIIYEEPYDGMYFGPYYFEYPDNATPNLDDIFEYATSYQENLTLKTTLDENLVYLILNYPQTEGWFVRNGILPENYDEKEKEIKKQFKHVEASLVESLNNEDSLTIESVCPIPNSDDEEKIKSKIDEIEKYLQDSRGVNRKSKFNREDAENNRLVFYYEQIQRCKELEEQESQKIELIKKFVNKKYSFNQGARNEISNRITTLISEETPEILEDSTTGNSISVLAKGRKTLDYMKKSVISKTNLGKIIEKEVINQINSISGDTTQESIRNELAEFIRLNSIPDSQEPSDGERML